MSTGAPPGGVDVVGMFLDLVEAARPPTPAVVIEHPDQIIVQADPDAVRALLAALIDFSLRHAGHRAEIRLELGARPGCSFFVRDNGSGSAGQDEVGALSREAGRAGGELRIESESGWGSTVSVRLVPGVRDDGADRGAYTGPLSWR